MMAGVARELLRSMKNRRSISPGVRILAYHGVVERWTEPRVEETFHLLSDFREHLAILRHCHVVSLGELDAAIDRRSLRPRVAITFDDGFRNNLLAAELLHAAKFPATFFATSENVQEQRVIWPTLVRLVLARGRDRIPQLRGERFDLDRDPGAFRRARARFKDVTAATRQALWLELSSQLRDGELDQLIADLPSISMMSPSDLRSLSSSGMTIGSHGLTHELHLADQPAAVRRHELSVSRKQLELTTGRPCTLFAYPNGTYHPGSAEEVRDCGYSAAFTMDRRSGCSADDRMLMPRLVPAGAREKTMMTLLFGN